MHKNKKIRFGKPVILGAMSGAAVAMTSVPASAFTIDTGIPDVSVRWDNTVKYNAGWRMEGQDHNLVNSAGFSSSTLSHDKHDMVTNRFDVLTEMDVVYKEEHGVRVSAAGWYDAEYDNDVKFNPAVGQTPYPNNKFTNDVERYYKQSGEILDAFAFTRFDLGSVPVNLKAGRHNIYWGESLFTFGDSIAYGQGPLDLRKATSTPGIEAKELFLPQSQVSASAQLTEKVSLAANYYLEWDPHRLPDGGTYLGASDVSLLGGQVVNGLPYLGDVHGGRNGTPDDKGSFGINMQIQSETLDGNVGLYYRRFDDRMPNVAFDPVTGVLFNDYAEDVKLYGISYNHLLGSISTGAEISRREDTALAGNARGDTWHALINMIAYIGKTPVFDSAPLSAELTYSRLDKVNNDTKAQFEAAQKGHGCNLDIEGGCVTKDAWGVNLSFTPTWYQVFPGIDMTMPITYGVGLQGNSPAPLGAAENSGSWSVGVGLDVYSQYKVNLAYNDYFGDYVKAPGSDQILASNGNGTLADRGWLSLTLKTTF
ncbi:hypothetical protein D9M68_306250 [compost metagenome]|uniref:DUF1302 domain-containing protein n=1 Tax=Pseudomonas jinjuensis TaxID=198616 RepID=A0A1H0EHJ5_9PSED|nr:DUF1302 domain-containing protein [Pseudomonas jinjuensis]SDN81957.1 Protein of unknown function [Pseudomonas jinjuensis]